MTNKSEFLSKEELFEAYHPYDKNGENFKRVDLDGRYKYYKERYEICKRYNPESILEIGVKFGYTAISFLCHNTPKNFTGIDCVEGEHGGVNFDTFDHVRDIIIKFSSLKEEDITLINKNIFHINLVNGLGMGAYDFIHVDADHSYDGCARSLMLAFNSCTDDGVIVVHDYNSISEVTDAVDDFVNLFSSDIKKHYYEKSIYIGSYIIELDIDKKGTQ